MTTKKKTAKKTSAKTTDAKDVQKPKAPVVPDDVKDKPFDDPEPEAPEPKAEKKVPKTLERNGTVTFAIRLPVGERDLIHEAAGRGKASRWVRQILVAAAKGDLDAVKDVVEKGPQSKG